MNTRKMARTAREPNNDVLTKSLRPTQISIPFSERVSITDVICLLGSFSHPLPNKLN